MTYISQRYSGCFEINPTGVPKSLQIKSSKNNMTDKCTSQAIVTDILRCPCVNEDGTFPKTGMSNEKDKSSRRCRDVSATIADLPASNMAIAEVFYTSSRK
jgi:hypothetical protein